MTASAVNDPGLPFGVVARAVFFSWEKLRLVYLAILVPFTLALAVAFDSVHSAGDVFPIFAYAIFANLCYFAGPLIEVYARWLGHHNTWLRKLLFASGTLVTMFCAVLVLAAMGIGNGVVGGFGA